MNRLNRQERAQVVAALVEGASINSTVRMTGISKPTILKLLKDLGTACKKYQEDKLRNLPCKRVQCDEIWSFCFGKDKNISENLRGTLPVPNSQNESNLLLTDLDGNPLNSISKLLLPFHPCLNPVAAPSHRYRANHLTDEKLLRPNLNYRSLL